MKSIKFSHDYPKLWSQKTAKLVHVEVLEPDTIPKELLKYDTKTTEGGYYEIDPKRRYLQLVFLGDFRIPFCTLRLYDKGKQKYYEGQIGEQFKIDVKKWKGK